MGVSGKQSTPNFPKNEHFLPPDTHTNVCASRGNNCSFFGTFGVLYLLETPVLRFAFLPYYRQMEVVENNFALCYIWTQEREQLHCQNATGLYPKFNSLSKKASYNQKEANHQKKTKKHKRC